jgi:hypothetical protein
VNIGMAKRFFILGVGASNWLHKEYFSLNLAITLVEIGQNVTTLFVITCNY